MGQRLRSIAGMIRVLGDALKPGMYGVAEQSKRDQRLALEKHTTQLPLQRNNGVRQGGLGDAAPSGRPRETPLLAERQEIADLAHLHVPPRPYRLHFPRCCHQFRACECEVVHTRRPWLWRLKEP